MTGRSIRPWAVFLAFVTSSQAHAQGVVCIGRAPPHPGGGDNLGAVLAAPHTTYRADTGRIVLGRDSTYSGPVLVIGGDVVVGARVIGDVVVVDGDLFVHPGADIHGRAVAIGGGVYPSTLARVRGQQVSIRDYTYDHRRSGDTTFLDYRALPAGRDAPVALSGFYGIGIPAYERSHGLSIPVGLTLSAGKGGGGTLRAEPGVAYRSQLGVFDPYIAARLGGENDLFVAIRAERGPASNDRWIRSDVINSLTSIYSGTDVRNYYRADRAEISIGRMTRFQSGEWEPTLGILTEDARSVRPVAATASHPWTLLGREDRLRILRINPPVIPGRITSAVAAARFAVAGGGVTSSGSLRVEIPLAAPQGARFAQTTLDAQLDFPTFGSQTFEFRSHAVVTSGDSAPPQRFAYLGGTGTIPTFELLQFGGDQLFFAEGVYVVPLEFWRVRFAGVPALSLRYVVGAAGQGVLPRLEQNVGIGAALSFAEVELLVEPVSRTRQFRAGLSFTR